MQINEIELNEFGVRFLRRNRRHLVCVTLLTQALSQTSFLAIPPHHYRDTPTFWIDLLALKRQKTSCVHRCPLFYPFSSKLPAFLKSIRLRRNALCTTQHQMAERTDAAKCYKKKKKEIKKQKQRQPNPTERVAKKGGAHWPRRSCPLRAGGSTCKKK